MKKSLLVVGISGFLFSHICLAAKGTVAVIGSGAAGVAAAERLQSEGFEVTVFEKSDRVGGKCFTTPSSTGRGVVELGAIQVGVFYPTVNKYVRDLGLKLRKYWPSRVLRWPETDAVTRPEDNQDGNPESNPESSQESSNAKQPIYRTFGEEYWPTRDALKILQEIKTLNSALKRYSQIYQTHFDQFPENSEFAMSFEDWADRLGLDHFKEDFRVWMTSYGYGDLREIPAYLPLYLVNTSSGLVAFRKMGLNLRMLAGGYGGLIESIINGYHLNVKTGIHIQTIQRSDSKVTIDYDDHGTTYSADFDQLVVACGFSCIEKLIPQEQLTSNEKKLLDDLVVVPYDVVIADVPQLDKGGYVLPQNLHSPGHVSLISKNSAEGNDVILYIPRGKVVPANQAAPHPSVEQLTEAVRGDMARFGFNEVKILQVQFWDDYFPHFGNTQSYHLLNTIQGQNRTIYVGAMARFEIVERAMSHAHDMVDLHILNKIQTKEASYLGAIRKYLGTWYRYFSALPKDLVNEGGQ